MGGKGSKAAKLVANGKAAAAGDIVAAAEQQVTALKANGTKLEADFESAQHNGTSKTVDKVTDILTNAAADIKVG